jgi:EpsI family protein
MITKRLLIAQVLLVLGLGSVFLLPKIANSTPKGIELKLPSYVNGGWFGEDQKITPMELQVLAKDTEFARKLYTNGKDQIFASIVLSGQDLDNSIHRPERCLPAQGWNIADSRVVQIPLIDWPQPQLATIRLHTSRQAVTHDGQTVTIYGVNYYWFVGAKDITPSHLQRTYIDIRDRIMYGYNQRWAYITIAATITKGITEFGRSEEETDAMVQKFIAELFPKLTEGQQVHEVAAKF